MKIFYLIFASFFLPMMIIMIHGFIPGSYYNHEFQLIYDLAYTWFCSAAFIWLIKKYFKSLDTC